jgi:hypothetical protein
LFGIDAVAGGACGIDLDPLRPPVARRERARPFVARQKRISVGADHFYIDLVFYHRILKCFVLIDLKMEPFKPADAGQMNFYLNWRSTRPWGWRTCGRFSRTDPEIRISTQRRKADAEAQKSKNDPTPVAFLRPCVCLAPLR